MARRSDVEKVTAREGGERVSHTTLTGLEQMLLRLLYTTNCDWNADSLDDLVSALKMDEDINDAQAELLEQLLTEEEADHQ